MAIVMRDLAAPDGVLRPCSHSWRVRRDTPSIFANSFCERPIFRRAEANGETSTSETRPTLPALISLTAWSNYSPMLRFASRSSSSFLSSGMFHLLFEGFENVARNAVNSTLSIDQKQPDFPGLCPDKIEDSDTTALASSSTAPAYLANSSGAAYHVASIWIRDKESLKNPVLVVLQVIMNLLRK